MINTNAIEKKKRLKRREGTTMLSIRLNSISLGLSFLAPQGEKQTNKQDVTNNIGFITRKMSSCYCLERAFTLSDELPRPS